MHNLRKIAIVGSGPAGLAAASVLVAAHSESSESSSRLEVHLFERRAGLGRKLLIAGSSGLNISHHASEASFSSHYEGYDQPFWLKLFREYSPKDWMAFVENELKLETFLGTSDRYFVRDMKASTLLKNWLAHLEARGVKIHLKAELQDFKSIGNCISLKFGGEESFQEFEQVCFFLGGGSWETETPSWLELFRSKGIGVKNFESSNVGFEVAWKPEFLKEAEGKPFKKIILTTKNGNKSGELMVTRYGLEGTPIYFHGCAGPAFLDLKPDLTLPQILERLENIKENLSPMRRVKQKLNLCEASLALVFHHSPPAIKNDLKLLAGQIKRFPILLLGPRPLSEAISSKGGVLLSELDVNFQLKKFPSLYCGGEMLDWDAPTGGFLIQGAVSQGVSVARNILKNKNAPGKPPEA